jgi:hypothetical protein
MRKYQLQFQRRGSVIRAGPFKNYNFFFIVRLHCDCQSRPSHISCFKSAVRNIGMVPRLHLFRERYKDFTHVGDAGYCRSHRGFFHYYLLLICKCLDFELRTPIVASNCQLDTPNSVSNSVTNAYFHCVVAFKIWDQLFFLDVNLSRS